LLNNVVIDGTPNSDAANLNGGGKGSGVLGIASSDAASSFQVRKRAFHQGAVAQFAVATVAISLHPPTFLDGMTASMLEPCQSNDLVLSCPRSMSKYRAAKPFSSRAATVQSAVVPAATKNRTGIPLRIRG
jgi:hypothetical protein